MSESRKSKTKIEKPKEEKKATEEELTNAAPKQEQIEQQLRWVRNWADFLIDNERRSGAIRLAIKGAIIEGIAPCLKYCSDQELYDLMDYIFPCRRCSNSSWNGRESFWRNRMKTRQTLADFRRVPVSMKRRFRCAA